MFKGQRRMCSRGYRNMHCHMHRLIIICAPYFPFLPKHTPSLPPPLFILSSSSGPPPPLLSGSQWYAPLVFALLSLSPLSASAVSTPELDTGAAPIHPYIHARVCFSGAGLLRTLTVRVCVLSVRADLHENVHVSLSGAFFLMEGHVCRARDSVRMRGGQVLL